VTAAMIPESELQLIFNEIAADSGSNGVSVEGFAEFDSKLSGQTLRDRSGGQNTLEELYQKFASLAPTIEPMAEEERWRLTGHLDKDHELGAGMSASDARGGGTLQ
jgi:hypothetical protein